MAQKLVGDRRISIEMACWALKESGHSREEVESFLRELKDESTILEDSAFC